MFPSLKDLRTNPKCLEFVGGCKGEIGDLLLQKLKEIDIDPALPLASLQTFSVEYFFDPDGDFTLCKINQICNEISQKGWTLRVHKSPHGWNGMKYMVEIYSNRQLFPLLDKYHGWTVHREFHPPRNFLYGSC